MDRLLLWGYCDATGLLTLGYYGSLFGEREEKRRVQFSRVVVNLNRRRRWATVDWLLDELAGWNAASNGARPVWKF